MFKETCLSVSVILFHKMQKMTLFGSDVHKGRRKDIKTKMKNTDREFDILMF